MMRVMLSALMFFVSNFSQGQNPNEFLERLNDYPHAQLLDNSRETVIDYEIGLGAMQKVRGAWRFKDSERLSGELTRYSWQIVDGFSSEEVMTELELAMSAEEGAELLFQCEGRACGHGAQWANRVFKQRVLYGRDDLQRYRVYGVNGGSEVRLVIYSSARTADRQYLHVELLQQGRAD